MTTYRTAALAGIVSAVAVAVTLGTAPQASAYVDTVTIAGSGAGKYGTNCTYTITVTGSPSEYVWMYDNGASTFGPQQFSLDSAGKGTTTWTPTATGTHYVQAWSYNGSQWAVAEVGTGTNLGSSCIVS